MKDQHEGKTATWAGNSPDIIQRHYKGLMKTSDAKEFWAITRDSLETIVIPLRHSFTSALANAGVATELQIKLIGHKSAAVHRG